MCGIVGTTFQENDPEGEIARHNVGRMTKEIRFRGPDHAATWTPTAQQGYKEPSPICLGASLLDISGSRIEQPLRNNNGALVFNGEVYSTLDVTGMEGGRGYYKHSGVSDTEWILEQFRNNDYTFLKDIDWHGTLAYFDRASNQLTLVRDHFGAKPLWVNIDRRWGNLLFSSSLSAFFQKSIDSKKLEEFYSSGNQWQLGNTPYKGIFSLSPGEVLIWDCVENKRIKSDNLWNGFKLERNEGWNLEEFRELCIESIRSVAIHSLPRGLMLSGGLDSSVIAGIMQNDDGLTCISSKFEDEYVQGEDKVYMKAYAEQCAQAERTADMNNLTFSPTLIKKNDLETWSHIYMGATHYFFGDKHRQGVRAKTFKHASDLGCKIILTGDGADELFTGYNNDNKFIEQSKTWTRKWLAEQETIGNYFDTFPISCCGDDPALNRSFWKLLTFGEANCLMSDSCAGMFGMEFRAPFLTQKFAKYCLTIPVEDRLQVPDEHKDAYGTYKYLLREGFEAILEPAVVENHKKTGWASPYNSRDNKENSIEMTNNVEYLRYTAR